MTTVPDPNGRPQTERPTDVTDTPRRDGPGPAPTPEHHPAEARPEDDPDIPRADVTPGS